jgi:subtilisin family serine protease
MAKLATCLAVAALGAQGARRGSKGTGALQTKLILGDIPILNYDRAFKKKASLSASLAAEEDWVVVMKPEATEEEIHTLCSLGNCLAEGHPGRGGVPYFEVRATEGDLELLLSDAKGMVKFVEPDDTVELTPELLEPAAASGLWGLDRIGTSQRSSTGAGTHIYVLDTGIRKSHSDFGGRVIPTLDKTRLINQRCISWSPLPCAGDKQGHGTHCAGTAGGATYGVAPETTLHAVKVLGDDGSGQFSWSYDALDFLATEGLRPAVASMSLGGRGTSEAMKVAVNTAVNAGVTVVVAGGNSNSDACRFSPAFVPNAITVGSTTSQDRRSSFSNYGTCTNIWAPGSSILSADVSSDDASSRKSGTSMACPHVSGAAALLLEKDPGMSSAKVLSALLSNALEGVLGDLKQGDTNKLLQVGN